MFFSLSRKREKVTAAATAVKLQIILKHAENFSMATETTQTTTNMKAEGKKNSDNDTSHTNRKYSRRAFTNGTF